ncbi:MAG TPA: hypothetical protein VFJ19_05640 [Nocardioidaceae bacterium]|nr:hypothetical protein [Nocardioidaceae bacterium]
MTEPASLTAADLRALLAHELEAVETERGDIALYRDMLDEKETDR